MNKKFNFNRYKMVICQDIAYSWKQYISKIAIVAILLSFIAICGLYKVQDMNVAYVGGGRDIDPIQGLMTQTMVPNIIIICTVVFFIAAASIFQNMKSKGQRINFLTLPASNLEKYLAQMTCVTIVAAIMLAIAVVVSDFIQFIFSIFMTPGHHASELLALFSFAADRIKDFGESEVCPMNHIIPDKYLLVLFFGSWAVWTHSFLVLGGSLYRKNPTLLSIISLIIIIALGGYICNFFAHINWGGDELWEHLLNVYHCAFLLAASIAIIIISAFNYWASYKIFTRMQVICNKWINI